MKLLSIANLLFATVLLLSSTTTVFAVSSGNLEYCNLETRFYGAPADKTDPNANWLLPMSWTAHPRVADFYTLRSGTEGKGVPTHELDVKTYTPGGVVPIYLRTWQLDKKFCGLVMYAIVKHFDTVTGKLLSTEQVGTWDVPVGVPFWTPATCKFKAVVHANANIKPLRNTFYWRAPAITGLGPVTFRAMIKQGEQGKGTFYYPAGELVLQEQDMTAPPTPTLHRGSPRNSCNNVCADVVHTPLAEHGVSGTAMATATPMACDEAGMQALNDAYTIGTAFKLGTAASKSGIVCKQPELFSCGSSVPAMSSRNDGGWCFYFHRSRCEGASLPVSQYSCSFASANPLIAERLCVCKAGTAKRDPVPDAPAVNDGAFGHLEMVYLQTPVVLDATAGLVLQKMIVEAHKVSWSVTAPAGVWVGLAFDAYFMENAYTIVLIDGAVEERVLGNHNAGSYLSSTAQSTSPITLVTHEIVDGMVTYEYSRAREVAAPRQTFPTHQHSYTLLWALGESQTFGLHASHVSTLSTLEISLHQRWIKNGQVVKGDLDECVNPDPISCEVTSTCESIKPIPPTPPTCIDANSDGQCDDYKSPVGEPPHKCVDADQNQVCDGAIIRITNSTAVDNTCIDANVDGMCDSGQSCVDANDDGMCDEKAASGAERVSVSTSALLLSAVVTGVTLLSTLTLPSSSTTTRSRRRVTSSSRLSASALTSQMFVCMFICVCLMVSPVLGHNWVNGLSRAVRASVAVPCQTRLDQQPHVQVSEGQEFEVEYATGHGESKINEVYLITVHEDDYELLALLTPALLDEYISLAPSLNVIDVTTGVYQKRHVAPFKKNEGLDYEMEITNKHELWIDRDAEYVKKSIRRDDEDVRLWKYKPEQRNEDARVRYVNADYPWIEEVSRYRLYTHKPLEVDLTRVSIPARKGPGNYIVHYMWGGYRDCIDVNVQPNDVPIEHRYGDSARQSDQGSNYAKIHHSEFRRIGNPSTECIVLKPDDNGDFDAQPCLDLCSKLERSGASSGTQCPAVQLVRYQNVSRTVHWTPSIPDMHFKRLTRSSPNYKNPGPCNHWTIHERFTAGCTDIHPNDRCNPEKIKAMNPTKGDMICYGLTPWRNHANEVEEDFEVAEDVYDPRFYSTTFLRLGDGGFINVPIKKTIPHVPWTFGNVRLCLSCAERKRIANMPVNMTPNWAKSLTTKCHFCPDLTLDDLVD